MIAHGPNFPHAAHDAHAPHGAHSTHDTHATLASLYPNYSYGPFSTSYAPHRAAALYAPVEPTDDSVVGPALFETVHQLVSIPTYH